MIEMRLTYLKHRGKDWIGIYFENYPSINERIRISLAARWSRTHRCWYIPLNRESYLSLRRELQGLVEFDVRKLKEYLLSRRGGLSHTFERGVQLSETVNRQEVQYSRVSTSGLHEVNARALQDTIQHLLLKSYSTNTISSYRSELLIFFKLLKSYPAHSVTIDQVKRYLQKCLSDGLSENTLHSRINALKYYYERVLGREKFFFEIPRPKKHFQLPRFFTQDEITAIIKASGNLKHRTMLMLTYSAGLRVSETVVLRVHQVDEARRCIFIHRAKGKKDRIVQLSPVLVVALREYKREYKISADGYLFSGQTPGKPYSTRSLQLVLESAKKQAGILKPGGIHALRHSFATHLLDKGTDVTMIMKLLGHNSIKTTLRYLHVTNRDLLQVISPIDDLDLR